MYIGVDDTDSVRGMCTTFLATELVREFSELDLVGNPRLVRLNPNVPWKTRGNGAIALRFGKGRGKARPVGEINGKPLRCYDFGRVVEPSKDLFARACGVVEELAVLDDERTNPGLVMLSRKPPRHLYWQAVRGVVTKKDHLSGCDIEFKRGWKNGRGLIGAASAVAWRPRDSTYELIAYRERNKWGRPRDIDEESVRAMDKEVKSTFNNYDYEQAHLAFAPTSPCPVLYGIRGDVESDLPRASAMVRSEPKDKWVIFLTNQGTDDHIQRASVTSLEAYTSVRVRGRVASEPRRLRGGHLVFGLTNGRSSVDCTIYEPAKGFRDVGGRLTHGDMVTVLGGVRERPFTINVEKLRVEELVSTKRKVANPLCGNCNKHMKSVGSGKGYRCAVCGRKAGEDEAEFKAIERDLEPGWYEPPVGSRRHLSKPLKRF